MYIATMVNRIIFIFLGFIILGWSFTPANAHVLQGPHILDLMTKKLGTANRLLVSQKLILYNNPQSNSFELSETLRYIFPEQFRSDILSDNAQRIHVISKGAALTVIDGKVIADKENWMDYYKDIILYRSRIMLQKRLASLGVNVSVSSLGRFQGEIAYVIGAQYPDESVPQVWIDKDTFRPMRWLFAGNNDLPSASTESGKDFLEVRYYNWQPVEKTWYPMRIELYQNDVLIRKINVDQITVSPSFPEDLFDIKHLQSIYSPASPFVQDQNKTEGLSEVQKAIEEFKKIYE
ncbi:MAG: hypothetical protein AUJ48_01370 [Deltaproteobacteria bacterium CG1_02_45_11]|nr:MAG: hypothetical protein AUJ48_01370 [Deltaproteobacteria bacterium CG1_02_45_11]